MFMVNEMYFLVNYPIIRLLFFLILLLSPGIGRTIKHVFRIAKAVLLGLIFPTELRAVLKVLQTSVLFRVSDRAWVGWVAICGEDRRAAVVAVVGDVGFGGSAAGHPRG